MAKTARVLISFVDGSYLYADLSRKVDSRDTVLCCNSIVGPPEGTPADKATIANSVARQSKAGACLEFIIPMSRINGISIQEEYLAKDVPPDMKALWDEPEKKKPAK